MSRTVRLRVSVLLATVFGVAVQCGGGDDPHVGGELGQVHGRRARSPEPTELDDPAPASTLGRGGRVG